MKKYILSAIATAGFCYILFYAKRNDSEVVNKISLEKNVKINTGEVSSEILRSKVKKTNSTTAIESITTDSLDVVSLKDENGSTTELSTKKLEGVLEMIDSKKTFDVLNPVDEISRLRPIDFRNKDSQLFSGNFAQENIIKLSLNYAYESGKLSSITCIKIGDDVVSNTVSNKIKMYDDESGYANIEINDKYFLRLAFGFAGHRFLAGEIYKKENIWKLWKKFQAFEDLYTKPTGNCPYY